MRIVKVPLAIGMNHIHMARNTEPLSVAQDSLSLYVMTTDWMILREVYVITDEEEVPIDHMYVGTVVLSSRAFHVTVGGTV